MNKPHSPPLSMRVAQQGLSENQWGWESKQRATKYCGSIPWKSRRRTIEARWWIILQPHPTDVQLQLDDPQPSWSYSLAKSFRSLSSVGDSSIGRGYTHARLAEIILPWYNPRDKRLVGPVPNSERGTAVIVFQDGWPDDDGIRIVLLEYVPRSS